MQHDTKHKTGVLLIGPVAPPVGGMTVSLDNLATSSLKEKYDVGVLDITGYRARNKHANPLQGFLHQFYLIFKLIGIFVTKNPSIVHVQMASFFYFYRRSVDIAISKLFGKKVILHLRGASFIDFYKNSPGFGKWIIRSALGLSDKVITLSDYWKHFLSSVTAPEKISVVPNGVKLSDFHLEKNRRAEIGLPESAVVVFFVGPIGKRKGAFDILDAIPKVTGKIKDVVFVFCGTGEFQGELEAFKGKITTAGLSPYIRYAGNISGQDLRDHYLSSDIFVLPSYAENLPNSLLEAMAAGLPVVVSDVGAIPEVVKDGSSGFIIKPGNIDSITEKVITLAQDGNLRKTMGSRNIELIKEKYDMPIIADKIGRIYEELLR